MNINLRDMSAEAMIGVSTEWVDPAWELRLKVEHDEVLGPIFRRVKAVHGELVSTSETKSPQQERIAELTAKMTENDIFHDRKGRGIFNGLEAAIDLADTPEEAERLIEFRDLLFPAGLAVTRQTYAEQAGMAQRVKEKLTPVLRTQLSSLVFGQRNALDEIDEWLNSALRIINHQAERARLGYKEDTGVVTRGDLRELRLAWIQTVNAMLNMLQFSELTEQEKNILVANLRHVSAAVRRRQNQRNQETPTAENREYYEEAIYPNLP